MASHGHRTLDPDSRWRRCGMPYRVAGGMVTLSPQHGPLVIGGLPIGSRAPLFLAFLGVHVAVSIAAVVCGAVAMWAAKGEPRHIRSGRWYHRSLLVSASSAMVLAVMRWYESYPLFILAVVSLVAVTVGVRAQPLGSEAATRRHAIGMSTSYIAMLTAFYVDNGPHLPLWRLLPPVAFWLLPAAVGVPLLVRALRRFAVIRGG